MDNVELLEKMRLLIMEYCEKTGKSPKDIGCQIYEISRWSETNRFWDGTTFR